jgi:hypothetical protein
MTGPTGRAVRSTVRSTRIGDEQRFWSACAKAFVVLMVIGMMAGLTQFVNYLAALNSPSSSARCTATTPPHRGGGAFDRRKPSTASRRSALASDVRTSRHGLDRRIRPGNHRGSNRPTPARRKIIRRRESNDITDSAAWGAASANGRGPNLIGVAFGLGAIIEVVRFRTIRIREIPPATTATTTEPTKKARCGHTLSGPTCAA